MQATIHQLFLLFLIMHAASATAVMVSIFTNSNLKFKGNAIHLSI